jgi:hypothetical protein
MLTPRKTGLVNIFMKGIPNVKDEYVESIKQMLEACDDIALLDLIFQLLKKVECA